MKPRVVIVGGDAAGMSAATRVRGSRPDAEVVVLETRGSPATRPAASRSSSAASSPVESTRSSPGRPRSIAGGASTCAPTTRRRPSTSTPARSSSSTSTPARSAASASTELLLATGGAPVRPDLPGIDLPFIHGVQSLDDAQALLSLAYGGVPARRHRRRWVHRAGDGRGVRRAWLHGDGGGAGAAAARRRRRRLRRSGWPRRCARTASTSAAASPSRGSSPGAVLTLGRADRGRPRHPRHRRAGPARSSPRRPGSSSAAGGRRARRRPPGDAAPTACGRPATAPRPRTWSPAGRCTSPSARTPTSTAGWPASTWPAATPAPAGCSARRSPSCARWRSP